MSKFESKSIEKAKHLRDQLGGTIFAFPINESDPFSAYSIVMYACGQYFEYPNATDISEAATGVLTLLEEMKKSGMDADYERNVRMVSYQAQIDAPNTVMRRLKKENISKPPFEEGKDFQKVSEAEGELISARGLLKLSYIEMIDEKNPKANQFMDKYYQLLAMRKYGKTAAAIKQEVRRMSKDQAFRWLEQTYKNFVHNDTEIMDFID